MASLQECLNFGVVEQESDTRLRCYYNESYYEIISTFDEILDYTILKDRIIVKLANRTILVYAKDIMYPSNQMTW